MANILSEIIITECKCFSGSEALLNATGGVPKNYKSQNELPPTAAHVNQLNAPDQDLNNKRFPPSGQHLVQSRGCCLGCGISKYLSRQRADTRQQPQR